MVGTVLAASWLIELESAHVFDILERAVVIECAGIAFPTDCYRFEVLRGLGYCIGLTEIILEILADVWLDVARKKRGFIQSGLMMQLATLHL